MAEDDYTALPPGTLVAEFHIGEVLGSGGFGITYLAHDAVLDREVAVKEYLPAELATRVDGTTVKPRTAGHADTYDWGLARFLDEARTLARFDHPNIVRVQRVLEANGTAYMVMTHEAGESIEQAAAAGRLRTQADIAALLGPLLEGLARVHEAGFVHRDIKPHNIIIRADGTPVLIDFGSARQAIGAETRTLTTLVTDGYAPFEQYNEAGIKDAQGPWTDIYGLAATLYRVITGKKPASALARAHSLLGGDPDPMLPAAQVAPAGFQPAFLAAIDHGLAFRAEDRPRDVAAWRAELEEAPADGGTVRREPEKPPVPGAPVRAGARPAAGDTSPGRRRAVAAVTLLAALAGGGWYWQQQVETTRRAAEDAQTQAAASAQAAREQADARTRAETEAQRAAEQQAAAEAARRKVESERLTAAQAAGEAERLANEQALTEERARADAAAAREVEQRQAAVRAQVLAAQRLLVEGRLIVPPGGNALEAFRAVLAQDPEQADALAGLAGVEAALVGEADQQLFAATVTTDAARAAAGLAEAGTLLAAARDVRGGGAVVTAGRERLAAAERRLAERARLEAEQAAAVQAERETAARETDAARAREADVERLLSQADEAIASLRLTSPTGSNAVEYLRQVLALAPDNAAARERLGQVVAKYIDLAERAAAAGDAAKAGGYLDRAESVEPGAEAVVLARERVAEVEVVAERARAEAAQKAEQEAAARAAANRSPGTVFRDRLADGSEGPAMVVVPAGRFTMGSPTSESGRDDDEGQHAVSIGQFAIGKYEVTFEDYDRFARATGRGLPDDRGWGRGTQPLINVDWADAAAYAAWLSQQTGKRYRLPTEAEWEYAARAGTQTAYWWGDEVQWQGKPMANCRGCGSEWDKKETAPVGQFEANAIGLHDLHGNVWEWTCSKYDSDYRGAEQRCASGGLRVLRGGSWNLKPGGMRSADRTWFTAGVANDLVGFRLAQDL